MLIAPMQAQLLYEISGQSSKQKSYVLATNSLVEMVKYNENVQAASDKVSSGANTAAGYANTAAQYASALSNILGAFGGR